MDKLFKCLDSIAKLSPSPNSNFSWGLSWLYSQLIQPPTHTSLILHLYSNDVLKKVVGMYK